MEPFTQRSNEREPTSALQGVRAGRSSRSRVAVGLIALLALAGIGALSYWALLPPEPEGADAPTADFSAARAFVHVERVGSQPHVNGSRAADDVRVYIRTTLAGLGIQTEVQDVVGAIHDPGRPFALARVQNLVATLPGTASTGRVFLVAHYDSVMVSPGANDDGAGVAALLETARALALGPRARNDVVLLFTDAEELGRIGAETFVEEHPLAVDGGVVLDVETAGSSGPAFMFETSPGNAGVVGVYASAARHPLASSLADELVGTFSTVRTDFTRFMSAGHFTGLDTEYLEGRAVYHTPEDRPAAMDEASLQHLGADTLALVRAFAESDLRTLSEPSASDVTYFPVLALLIHYPGWLIWPIALAALLAVAVAAVVAVRRGQATWPRVVAGLGLGIIPLLLAPAAAQVLWALLVAVRPGYAGMIDPWQPGWYRAAVVALVAAVLLTWYGTLRRPIWPWPMAIGGLGCLALIGLVLATLVPGASYLVALPALAGATAAIVALAMRRPIAGFAVLAVGGAAAALILAPSVVVFFPAVGLAMGGAVALIATLLGLALLPMLDWLYPDRVVRRPLWSATPAVLATVLAVVFAGVGLGVDRFDAAHPAPAHLMYALDADTRQARWVSFDASPGAWTRRYVTGREDLSRSFPLLEGEVATGPAQAVPLAPPKVTVVSDARSGAQRTLSLTLVPQRAVRLLYFTVGTPASDASPRIIGATVAGRTLPVEGAPVEGRLAVEYYAPDAAGITVTLVLDGPGAVQLRVIDASEGLAGLPGFTERPAGVGVAASVRQWTSSELVLVARSYGF